MDDVKDTCISMLKNRKYKNITVEEDNIHAEKPDGHMMCVFLTVNNKLSQQSIRQYVTLLKTMNYTHGIIIYNTVTASAKKLIYKLPDETKIEIFQFKELKFDITKHCLQPSSFEGYSDELSELFKKKYGEKIPMMKITDPISRYYDFKVGSIIKITRKAGFVSFRIVVSE